MGCGRRWAVETAFSTYKRLYGEYCMSRNIENIERELKAKSTHIPCLEPSNLRVGDRSRIYYNLTQ
jgi:hypothetical protein